MGSSTSTRSHHSGCSDRSDCGNSIGSCASPSGPFIQTQHTNQLDGLAVVLSASTPRVISTPASTLTVSDTNTNANTNTTVSRKCGNNDPIYIKADVNDTKVTLSPQPPIIVTDISELDDLHEILGRGHGGSRVQLYYHRVTCTRVALKIIDRRAAASNTNRAAAILREKSILMRVKHTNIVRLYGTLKDESHLYFVLSYGGHELSREIVAGRSMLHTTARSYAQQLASAIGYLHSNGVVHRDIKPKNVLVSAAGHICLVDFGSVALLDVNQRTRTLCGTYHYYAPEMLVGQLGDDNVSDNDDIEAKQAKADGSYGSSVDWWAFGCLLFEMVTGSPPFFDDDRYKCYDLILHSSPVFPPVASDSNAPANSVSVSDVSTTTISTITVECYDILVRLLDKNPATRLADMQHIMNHPFFK